MSTDKPIPFPNSKKTNKTVTPEVVTSSGDEKNVDRGVETGGGVVRARAEGEDAGEGGNDTVSQLQKASRRADFINALVTEGFEDDALFAIREGMSKAMMFAKGVGWVPDYEARAKLAFQVLAYTQGQPARRFEILQANLDATKLGMGKANQEIEMTDATVEAMEDAIKSYKLSKYAKATGRKTERSE